MAISKIKAMTETLSRMEKMEREVVSEISTDIDEKRLEALGKIRSYMDELAKALAGRAVCITVSHIRIFSGYSDAYVHFNETYCMQTHDPGIGRVGSKWSADTIPWHIIRSGYKQSNEKYENFIDGETNPMLEEHKWSNGYITLIENWDAIKEEIESLLEERLTEDMDMIRKRTETEVKSYKLVEEFEA